MRRPPEDPFEHRSRIPTRVKIGAKPGTASLLAVMASAMVLFSAGRAPADSRAEPAASEQQLAKIVNTRDDNVHLLSVKVDGKADITGIRFETSKTRRDPADRGAVAPDIRIREFSPAAIASRRGVVLDGTPGHDAIILQGVIAPGAATTSLAISYLYNGITGETRVCRVSLDRGRGTSWRLINSRNQPVSLIVVKTWALPIIGTVGIETLQGICAEG